SDRTARRTASSAPPARPPCRARTRRRSPGSRAAARPPPAFRAWPGTSRRTSASSRPWRPLTRQVEILLRGQHAPRVKAASAGSFHNEAADKSTKLTYFGRQTLESLNDRIAPEHYMPIIVLI